jgi:hypothetical protein
VIPHDYYRFETRMNSYFIRDRNMDLIAYCLVKGRCITHPTIFKPTAEEEDPLFRMEAKRKVLNRTYYLFDPLGTRPFATIAQGGKGLWRVLDDTDRERCVFVDSGTKGEKVAEAVLGGSPDRYAVIAGDRVLAQIRMEPRPEKESSLEDRGFFKRIVKAVTRRSDWVMALEEQSTGVDHRTLIAGMILLIEQTIAMSRSR